MKLLLDQLFFGRDARGYGLLGFSPGASPLAARVDALCGSVGTPGGDYAGDPFLLSVPDGDRILMICGRRGAPDSMGRSTLFFHALVAGKKDLAAANANALALFEQGAFSDKMPAGGIPPIRIDIAPDGDRPKGRPAGACVADASLPAVFRSDKPSADLLRVALGGRANELSWATFAFQALPRFDAQVLPPRVPAPARCNEYDSSGALLRAGKRDAGEETPCPRPPSRQPSRPAAAPRQPAQSSAMLRLSLAANAALAVLCIVLYSSARRRPEPVRGKAPEERIVETIVVEAPPSPDATNQIGNAAIAAERRRLAAEIPSTSRIRDFDAEYGAIPGISDWEKEVSDLASLRANLRRYVDFVNGNFSPAQENDNP